MNGPGENHVVSGNLNAPLSAALCSAMELPLYSVRRHRTICVILRTSPVPAGGFREFQRQYADECTSSTCDTSAPTECAPKDLAAWPVTRVLPFLLLGNEADARDLELLQRLGVGYVLQVTAQPLPGPQARRDAGLRCKRIPASDSCHQNLKQFFDEAFTFLGRWETFASSLRSARENWLCALLRTVAKVSASTRMCCHKTTGSYLVYGTCLLRHRMTF